MPGLRAWPALNSVWCPSRTMAVWVDVEDNNIEQALTRLRRRVNQSGLPEELRKRQHHLRKSQQRFVLEKAAYNREMARRITQRLNWLWCRKYVEK